MHDSDNQVHYTDCFYGMSNLAGNQSQMAQFVASCYEQGIQLFDFSDIMRKAHTDEDMLQGYKKVATKDI